MTPKTCSWSVDVPGQDPVIVLWAWWVSLALSRFHAFVIPCADSSTISVLYANDTITSPEMSLLLFTSVFSLRQLVVEMMSTATSPSSISRCHLIRELFEHSIISLFQLRSDLSALLLLVKSASLAIARSNRWNL